MIRSFIAVHVPPESAGKLRAAQERLKEADGGVKWVEPDNFHITLKFLGEVDKDQLQQVWRSVVEALEGQITFPMRFRGVGAFPSPKRARVIWAGVADGGKELVAMAARVEPACLSYGFEPEQRPFHPHLTLGRVRNPRPNPELMQAIIELAQTELGEFCQDRVLLMKSELRRTGPIYSVMETKMLEDSEKNF